MLALLAACFPSGGSPLRLRAAHPGPRPPDTGEGEQRAIIAKREPIRYLRPAVGVLAERCRRHKATVRRREPTAPIATLDIAHIGDRPSAEVWRWREAPAHQLKGALAVFGVADDRRELIGEDVRQRWKIACAVVLDLEQAAHRFLRLGHGIEVAHVLCSSLPPGELAAGNSSRALFKWPADGFHAAAGPSAPRTLLPWAKRNETRVGRPL